MEVNEALFNSIGNFWLINLIFSFILCDIITTICATLKNIKNSISKKIIIFYGMHHLKQHISKIVLPTCSGFCKNRTHIYIYIYIFHIYIYIFSIRSIETPILQIWERMYVMWLYTVGTQPCTVYAEFIKISHSNYSWHKTNPEHTTSVFHYIQSLSWIEIMLSYLLASTINHIHVQIWLTSSHQGPIFPRTCTVGLIW